MAPLLLGEWLSNPQRESRRNLLTTALYLESVRRLADLETALIEHAEKVRGAAEGLREKGISYRLLVVKYKPRWEREALKLAHEYLGRVALLGKDSGFIGEGGEEWICICDLLDGSLNFMCGLKYYAYSFALARRGELVYGLVIDLHDMAYYRAERGRGAQLVEDGVSRDLRGMATSVPANFDAITTNVVLRGFNSVELRCASLELCYLARGAAQFWVGRTWVPDVAASFLIVLESGFKFADWSFKPLNTLPLDYTEVKCVASTPKILEELKAKFKSMEDAVVPV